MLPWFEHARRDPDASFAIGDCATCLSKQDRVTRQALACAYEPPAPDGIAIEPWDHHGRNPDPSELDDDGRPRPQVCAGYVCRLPEVMEAVRARTHWEKGGLRDFCGGPPSERLLEAIEVLDHSASGFNSWRAKPANEGGGGS